MQATTAATTQIRIISHVGIFELLIILVEEPLRGSRSVDFPPDTVVSSVVLGDGAGVGLGVEDGLVLAVGAGV